MASIRPFRAVRPAPDAAARVAAVPYDVVSVDEARALASGNPLSFLHVSRAEIDLDPATSPYSADVYATAARNYERLKKDAPLLVEADPSLYFYRLRMGDHTQTGLAAAYSLDEYERDVIKKHERTRPDKENDRTRHMVALGAQTGPVFLTYRAAERIDNLAAKLCAGAPLFDFEAVDGVRHTLWRVADDGAHTVAREFERISALYIADGHHRAASAARTRAAMDGSPSDASPAREAARVRGPRGDAHAWFLAVAFPHNQVQILPYNRIVKDLGGLTPEAFTAQLQTRFGAREGASRPAQKGWVSVFTGARWHEIALPAPGAGSPPDRALDVSLLQDHVLSPILKVGDPRTDKRIDFVGGARGPAELERLVRAGQAAAAFSLFPVTVDDLMRIADAGGVMPPKSTWFEPKLRDGLLIHEI